MITGGAVRQASSRLGNACCAAAMLLAPCSADAHRIDEFLQATILSIEPGAVIGAMRLIPGASVSASVIDDIDKNADGKLSEPEQNAYAKRAVEALSFTVNGQPVQPVLVSCSFPEPSQMREGLGEINIDYRLPIEVSSGNVALVLGNSNPRKDAVYLVNVLVPKVGGIEIRSQKRNPRQSVYEVDFRQAPAVPGVVPGDAWQTEAQFLSSLFRLGVQHIAKGTDHLLFLLVLLLPAPLIARGSRWAGPASVREGLLGVLGIVTAFTVGHSITLATASIGGLHVPSRPVEVFIALSILISAIHAWRPFFPRRETTIAAAFGLVHGLAFAETLDRLGLDAWSRFTGTMAFNLGIEAMQLLIVAAVLPPLLVLSRTAFYQIVRSVGAVLAGVASLSWLVERLFAIQTPVDRIVDTLALHAGIAVVTLWIAGFLSFCIVHSRWRRCLRARKKGVNGSIVTARGACANGSGQATGKSNASRLIIRFKNGR